MFTGIVEETGILHKITNINSGEKEFTIKCKNILVPKIKLGDSISVDGACLTVTDFNKSSFKTLSSLETLSKTSLGLKKCWIKIKFGKSFKSKFKIRRTYSKWTC